MHSLQSKILLVTLFPLFIVLMVISIFATYNKKESEQLLLLQRFSTYQSLLESGDLSLDSAQDKTKLESILDEKVEFAEILQKNYTVTYSTENTSTSLITDDEKKEVDEAFKGMETTKSVIRNGKSTFVIISPLIINGVPVAVLHQGLSNELSSQRVNQYATFIFLLAFSGMVVSYLLISFLLNDAVLKHIYSLKQATIEMQKGNTTTPIKVNSHDEIGDFAKALDDMRSEVNSVRIKQEKYRTLLEDEVRERTQELEVKLDELEQMNKLMIGREMKMVELKNELDAIKAKR